tara:strand:- start:3163 stop:3648 length:486 start_codon:yes stop_codon:yes gene_type:complete
MKTIVTLTIASLMAISPVAVVNAQQNSDKEPMSMGMMHSDKSMPMGMMDEAKMEKMQKHISEMDTLLEQVKKETDPEKREEMLHKHAQSMEDMMATMHGKHKGKGSSMGKHNMAKMKKGEQMPAEQKMEMMENRLMMMEQMMNQMMGHTAEKSKKIHNHKP